MTNKRLIHILEWIVIIVFCFFPLLLDFPYRINIFLSWEGAYRISQGQIPFRDFGMPLGFMYWVVPSAFFKVFGPYMMTLLKAQAFINLITLISFRQILKKLKLQPALAFATLILFCISYILINFWPWYNNSVFVYQLISILFLINYAEESQNRRKQILFLALSAIFSVFSFFTKQDGGALAIFMNIILLAYLSWVDRRWFPMPVFLAVLFFGFLVFILPFSSYDFGYWFNYGQEPHFSRLSLFDIVHFFLQGSFWIKFYLTVVLVFFMLDVRKYGFSLLIKRKMDFFFFLLTIGFLVQASIIQVTSYVPINNNIYFHSFCFAFIVSKFSWPVDMKRLSTALIAALLIMLWWSGSYYKYVNRVVSRFLPADSQVDDEKVSIRTYNQGTSADTTEVEATKSTKGWRSIQGMKSFEGLYMPRSTVDGINRLRELPLWKGTEDPVVLNMTELTPLAYELDFDLETGPQIPLWYHLNVSFFDRELILYKGRIESGYYDLVLFENIPNLNNFYPFEIREVLKSNYHLIDSFDAPRKHGGSPKIEVYIPLRKYDE